MSKLPLVDAKKLEKFLFYLGFEKIRQKGSHVFYRHPDGRSTTLPHHKGRIISRPLLREILREIRVSPEEYSSIIKKV